MVKQPWVMVQLTQLACCEEVCCVSSHTGSSLKKSVPQGHGTTEDTEITFLHIWSMKNN